MTAGQHLLIFGASARAAAFSALRAGLLPWCADLFGDADLQARCPALSLAESYPRGLLNVERQAPPGPLLYTGGLENHPRLVARLARRRPLWGNDTSVLARARSPETVQTILKTAGLSYPASRLQPPDSAGPRRWLRKPQAGAGGAGIRFWTPDGAASPRGVYYQEYVAGEACSALYLGDGQAAELLGVTHQLVGEPWLHAAAFHYCGSLGPVPLDEEQHQAFRRLGSVLAAGCGLLGLFGIDCVLCEGIPWPVEVNPRYTASVEVLEYGAGVPALALHRRLFDPAAPAVPVWTPPRHATVGKAILFARAPLTFPASGPWQETLRAPPALDRVPAFADLPHSGQQIEAGWPILTLFATASSTSACQDELRRGARDLDRWLYRA